ncbi:DUF3231 family protein [Priestia aryabhattai]|uniref:DUF3231 family protein n=1 Tax=Priestia aryabhattai TaxID=412384 RepID=UPI001C8E4230|nr:DUF3231 family protein [Priestia aryabhattai]MBY0061878.1 DUF3231 family protein [Priestia aryabhattai]
MNVMESLLTYLKSTHNDDFPPLHIGEAMGCWLYFTALAEEIPALETSLHTTTDKELVKLVNESKDLAESQLDALKHFMLKEGLPLSEIPAAKPELNSQDIPLGAKATDTEISNLISVKVASNIVMCSTNISQAIREDLGTMWLKFHTEKVLFGVKVKKLMQEKGWLKYPPTYYPPGAPHK